MAFEAGSISAKLSLDTSEFSRGILQAQGISQAFGKSIAAFVGDPLLGLVNAAKQAAGALKDIFLEVMEFEDRSGEVADALGVPVGSLTALAAAARSSGGDLNSVSEALKFLNKSMFEAISGDEKTIDAFARLGIAVQDIRSNSSDAIFLRMADGMRSLSTGAERTATAMQLLGRGGNDMVTFLNQGTEKIREQMQFAEQMGAVVTDSAARQSGAWSDLVDQVMIGWEGIKIALAEPIRDALMPMLEELVQWMREHPEEVKAKIREITDAIAGTVQALYALAKILAGIVELASKFSNFLGGGLLGRMSPVIGMFSGAAEKMAGGTAGNSSQSTMSAPVSVNVQSKIELDPAATASQIGRQLQPVVRDANRQMQAKLSAQLVQRRI